MLAPWTRRVLLAVGLTVHGCSHGHAQEAFDPAPPTRLPQAVLLSDVADGPDPDDSGADRHHAGTDQFLAGASTVEVVAGPLTLRAGLSHSLYSKSFPKRLVLKVDLAGAANQPRTRRPLNLALVFDRSGSMAQDQKFTYAMQAAELVIDNLADGDVISLIAFNQTAVVLSPAGPAVNKDFLHHRLTEITPDGYTNLSAGLLESFAQIDSHRAAEQSKQVIVLTDGLANRGITDRGKLRTLVSAAHARGIGVSTLGCGTEFDEKLLTDLATAGGGRYTYIRSPEQIPQAIAAELDGLLDVVAQNVELEIRAVSGGTITGVYGRLIDGPISSHSVELGDIRHGEHGLVVLQIAPDRFEEGATVAVDVILTMDDPETGLREQSVLRREATFSRDVQRSQLSENQAVLAYADVLDAMERAEEAIQGLDIERFRQAGVLFDRLYDDARRYAIETRDQQLLNQTFLLKHFMAELSAAGESALMHDHRAARKRIAKDVDYRRYLLEHHRSHRDP